MSNLTSYSRYHGYLSYNSENVQINTTSPSHDSLPCFERNDTAKAAQSFNKRIIHPMRVANECAGQRH